MPVTTWNFTRITEENIWQKLLTHPGLVLAFIVWLSALSQAQSLSVIHSFNGPAGASPAYVNVDAAGNVYGTTFYGGRTNHGIAYKLSRHGSSWIETVLYEFTAMLDGGNPTSGLTIGPDGSFYGVTNYGGMYGYGVVYRLRPPTSPCKSARCYWNETVLYNFTGGADGAGPQGNLIFDHGGNLYGTTLAGVHGTSGALYELSPAGDQWNITIIHTFSNSSDGGVPANGVLMDPSGNLYGVTETGGATNNGLVYKFTNSGAGWNETILHDFSGSGQPDGTQPGGLAFDAQGNLYGMTTFGGPNGEGYVYQLKADSGGYTFSTIYNFDPQIGSSPGFVTAPIVDSAGNVYGTSQIYRNGDYGNIFKLSNSGGGWVFTNLHNFSGRDGVEPGGTLAFDTAGNLYGATESGGLFGSGTVWELTP